MLMCQTPKFWELFCTRIERIDLVTDRRFDTIVARRANLIDLTAILDAHLSTASTKHWIDLLGGHVPVAPIHSLAQALQSDHVRAIQMSDSVEHPDAKGGQLSMLASPIKVNGERPKGMRAPKLGEHSQ